MSPRIRSGPKPSVPKLAMKYGRLAPSPSPNALTPKKLLAIAGLLVVCVWGAMEWAARFPFEVEQGTLHVRRVHHHAKPVKDPGSRPTNLPDGRLVG